MADSKRDYERGYHDAREGKDNKGAGIASSSGLGALLPGRGEGDNAGYQKGYREGKEDREHNKK